MTLVMMALLRLLPVVVLIAAAIDSSLVRFDRPHRGVDPDLFLQASLLWLVFGLLALVPAWPTRAALRRWLSLEQGEKSWGVDVAALGSWLALPVLGHGILDRYTSIGQNISALKAPRPWLEVGALILGLVLVAWLIAPRLRAIPGKLAAVLGLLAALVVGLGVGPRAEESGSPRIAPADAPNLMLLVWDTTRSMALSPYGYDRETTPHLAELAKKSLVWEEARSVSCFTLTSHLSMLTGVYPSHHGARLTRMFFDPRKTPSLAHLLREHGYRTGGFVGTNVLRAGTGMMDGFEVYDDECDPLVVDTHAWKLVHDAQSVMAKLRPSFGGNGSPHWIEDFARPAPEVLERALDWIQEEDERPWFCLINLYDVHWPYLPNDESREKWVRPYEGTIDGYLFDSDSYQTPDGVLRGSRLTSDDKQHLRDLYDAEMWQLDRRVHQFLSALDLERSGTAVLVTSDHGEAFGEAGIYEHNDILEPQVRVPFMLVPARGEGRTPPDPAYLSGKVSGIDVATTLAGLAGLESTAVEGMTGLDLLAGEVPESRQLLVEDRDKKSQAYTHYAVYEDHWKLVRTGVGPTATHQLFDLRADSVGERDISGQQPAVAERLEELLDELRSSWGGGQESWKARAITDAALHGLGYAGEDDDPE